MRILAWNVQESGGGRVTAQLEAVLQREADLLALRAVSQRGYEAWRAGLHQAGYCVISSAELLEVRPQLPQLLCGDFNMPQPEREGEPVRTFAEFYPDLEGMWDAAERGILEHPRLRDAYKQVHKPGDPWAYSYRVANSKDRKERRYDHICVSEHFEVRRCRYLIDWLAQGLSDHAGVEADIALNG